MKKIFIINWKWTQYPNDNNQKQIYLSGENKLIITKYTIDEVKNFNDRIKSIVEVEKPEELLVLTHANKDSQICIPESCISVLSNDKLIMKIKEFRGSHNHYIYCSDHNKTGILNSHDLSRNDAIIIENYGETWDYYWNELELEYQKKKIINLWLPLAIDIQGLSETNDENSRTQYLTEIEKDVQSYAENHAKEWEKVKKILIPIDEEVLDEKYRLTLEEKEKVKFPIEKEKTEDEQFKEISSPTLKKYVEENWKLKKDNPNAPNFLPNWLPKCLDVIDNILAGRPNSGKVNE